LTHLGRERITQIRLRGFEAIMCGAFHMTEYMPELEEFFEVGKEMVCYTDPDDVVEKCKYYLSPARVSRQYRRAAGVMLGLWDIAKSAR
jgi:spore maturation protein CgeB